MLRVTEEEAWSGIRNKKQLSPEGEYEPTLRGLVVLVFTKSVG